ncbi:MAG: division/cell wall cluster transcriptional repressor MraZ [Gammaproteobacteria bacterium]|nr:division/cell wall cluster transcriptional repressor MraZ [Gammaproteobacteria bacterium]
MYKFRGDSSLSLDAKGRLVLPAKYRERLSESCNSQIVVTIDTDQPCLLMYPLDEWEKIEEKIDALPSFNPATRRIQRLLIGHATDGEVDANGRFLLSSTLREYAQLTKKVVLIGQGKKFEIWDEANWSQSKEDWLSDQTTSEMPEALAELSL